MEEATRSRLIQSTESLLVFCEIEISTLAYEALSPTTSAKRRAEVLILRAKMQTKTVSLLQQLKRLAEPDLPDCKRRSVERQQGEDDCFKAGCTCRWLENNDLFRAS